jgi:hypothetical protein
MSSYVPLSHVKKDVDQPVPTDGWIKDYVLSHIPYTPSPDSETRELVRQSELEHFAEILDEEEICPSQIEPLSKFILETAKRSLIVPGDSTGFVAAEAGGAIRTQAALNSFHGSSSVGDSADVQADIVSGSKNPKTKILTIFFEDDQLDFEDILNKRRSLSASYASDFIISYETKPVNEIEKKWWTPNDTQADVVLRIHLNWIEMYKQRVTIHQLSEAIRAGETQDFSVFHGGIMDKIIDIYPNKIPISGNSENKPIAKRYAEESYLSLTITSSFSKIHVKGIVEVGPIEPKSINLGSMIQNLSKKGERWKIRINLILANHQGITKTEYMNVFEKLNCEIEDVPDTGIFFCELPETKRYETKSKVNVIKQNGALYAEVPDYIEHEDAYYYRVTKMSEKAVLIGNGYCEKVENPLLFENILYDRLPNNTPINLVSPFDYLSRQNVRTKMYALARGTNFAELLRTPGIDKTRTICSNMHVISLLLGSEAARTYGIKMSHESISKSKNYVNPSNIILLPSIINSKGIPLGARYAGIARQGAGFLSLATIEKASLITKAALFGRTESVVNTSVAISLGDYIHLGTHYFNIGQNVNGKTYTNEDVHTLGNGYVYEKATNKLLKGQKVADDDEQNQNFVPNDVIEKSTDPNPPQVAMPDVTEWYTAPITSPAYDPSALYKDLVSI